MGISLYENEQQIINAEEQFKEIMGGMMSFMTAVLTEISNGNLVLEHLSLRITLLSVILFHKLVISTFSLISIKTLQDEKIKEARLGL